MPDEIANDAPPPPDDLSSFLTQVGARLENGEAAPVDVQELEPPHDADAEAQKLEELLLWQNGMIGHLYAISLELCAIVPRLSAPKKYRPSKLEALDMSNKILAMVKETQKLYEAFPEC